MVQRSINLRVSHLSKHINSFNVLNNISFKIFKGEVVAVLGPSGAGKTMLLKSIAGLVPISSGAVEYFPEGSNKAIFINRSDKNVKSAFGKVSLVFQDLQLWPHKSVLDNIIEAPIYTNKLNKKQAISKAYELCNSLNILEQINKFPNKLSVGQRQRVAIARTLANDPEIILLDEITSALDPINKAEIIEIITNLANTKVTLIIVTHDIRFAYDIAERFLFIFSGEIKDILEPHHLKRSSQLPSSIIKFLQSANKEVY